MEKVWGAAKIGMMDFWISEVPTSYEAIVSSRIGTVLRGFDLRLPTYKSTLFENLQLSNCWRHMEFPVLGGSGDICPVPTQSSQFFTHCGDILAESSVGKDEKYHSYPSLQAGLSGKS